MGEDTTVPPDEETVITKRFELEWDDKEKIEEEGLTIDLERTGWWDETYIYQVCECDLKKTLIFARDENGVYDPNGEIKDSQKKVSHSHSFFKFCNSIHLQFKHLHL